MLTSPHLVRPATFEAGEEYFWQEQSASQEEPHLIPVRFVSYAACPAFIYICNRAGKKMRCPRDELFCRAAVEL